jgi:hypothetical protein
MQKLLVCGLAFLVFGCSENDLSHDEAALMKIHEQAREFHFSKNAQGMVNGFADNFITANRGKLDTVLSRQEDSARFQHYFDAVKFKKWDDLSPPIIRFSDDHSLAYMTINKIVVLERKDTAGNLIESTTHFVWVSIFRKQKNNDWKLECVASTNEPEIIKPL